MVVSPKGKGDVTHAAADQRAGQVPLDPSGRLDKVQPIGRVFLNPRRHREDVWIEDNILGRKIQLCSEEVISALADLLTAGEGVCLAPLIKRHHHDRRAIPKA